MRRSKRAINATAEDTLTPPDVLSGSHVIARIVKGEGKNIWKVHLPTAESVLVELPNRFRSTFWLKRGSFVVVDRSAFQDRKNQLFGEIVNLVGNEKLWRKQSFW